MLVARLAVGLSGGSLSSIQQGPTLVDSKEWEAIHAEPGNGNGLVGGVAGHVYDKETSEPIEGVLVSFQLQSDQTDLQGHYELGEIPVGSQTFTFVKGGYKVAQRDATIIADDWITLDIELTPGEGPEPEPELPNLLWLWLLLGVGGAAIVAARTKKLLEKDKRS